MTLKGAVSVHGNRRNWPELPLRAFLTQSKAVGRPHLPLLGVSLHEGVRQRSTDDGRAAASEDLSSYKLVKPGDAIMNRLGKPHGSVGVSPWTGITSPAYWVLNINRELTAPRFAHHLLRSCHLVREYERLGKFMPPNQFDITWDAFREITVPLPSLEEQLRIANFLDGETDRIDALRTLSRSARQLLDERESAFLNWRFDDVAKSVGTLPFRRLIRSMDQGSSPQCDAVPAEIDEWGVLKVSAIRPGRFFPDENKRLPKSEPFDKADEVHEGDLLITRANTPDLVGSTTVVPKVRRGLLLCDKIFRVKLTGDTDPHYIAAVARWNRVRDLSSASSNGASQSMANIRFEEVKSWPIPNLSAMAQRGLAVEVSAISEQTDALKRDLDRQHELLAERKQALITAAVTGQIDVTTARGADLS